MIYHNGSQDLDGLNEAVSMASILLQKHRSESRDSDYDYRAFDAIVVTGMSGVIVGVPVSLMTGIPLLIVRKESDTKNHSYIGRPSDRIINRQILRDTADRPGARNIVFLDDLIDSGETRDSVAAVLKEYRSDIEIVATYEYDKHDYINIRPDVEIRVDWDTDPDDYYAPPPTYVHIPWRVVENENDEVVSEWLSREWSTAVKEWNRA